MELLVECLEHAIDKEQEIPKLIMTILNKVNNKDVEEFNVKENMRTAEEILKDYGLGGVAIGER